MFDLIVLVPDHYLSFYFSEGQGKNKKSQELP